MTIAQIAQTFGTSPKVLERESLKAYLEKKLNLVSQELFFLQKEYNIKTAKEFEKAIKSGKIHEFEGKEDNQENFFKFMNLEKERKKILKLFRNIK